MKLSFPENIDSPAAHPPSSTNKTNETTMLLLVRPPRPPDDLLGSGWRDTPEPMPQPPPAAAATSRPQSTSPPASQPSYASSLPKVRPPARLPAPQRLLVPNDPWVEGGGGWGFGRRAYCFVLGRLRSWPSLIPRAPDLFLGHNQEWEVRKCRREAWRCLSFEQPPSLPPSPTQTFSPFPNTSNK